MEKYIHYGHTLFNIKLFHPIENAVLFTKPNGGFWASNINAKYGWKTMCDETGLEKCDEKNSFVFSIKDNAKILRINSTNDLENLPKKDKDPIIVMLDFEKLSQSYDAVEVNISSDEELYYQLYWWDCDSIVIMNPDVIVHSNKCQFY